MYVLRSGLWQNSSATRILIKEEKNMSLETLPPYLRAQGSVPQIMWIRVLALLVPVTVSLIVSGGQTFRILVMATAGSVLSEMGMRYLLKKPSTLYDGSTVEEGLLLALLLPTTLPSWMVVLGALFATAVGKEAFGGLGQNPFHPVLVGNAFLSVTFPLAIHASSPSSDIPLALASVVGGVLLIFSRVIRWDIPAIYLLGVFFFSFLLRGENVKTLEIAPLFLTAFFVVTDSVTSPLTLQGRRGFALGAAFLTTAFHGWTAASAFEGITYGILLMNALTPWFDEWFRPARARRASALL